MSEEGWDRLGSSRNGQSQHRYPTRYYGNWQGSGTWKDRPGTLTLSGGELTSTRAGPLTPMEMFEMLCVCFDSK